MTGCRGTSRAKLNGVTPRRRLKRLRLLLGLRGATFTRSVDFGAEYGTTPVNMSESLEFRTASSRDLSCCRRIRRWLAECICCSFRSQLGSSTWARFGFASALATLDDFGCLGAVNVSAQYLYTFAAAVVALSGLFGATGFGRKTLIARPCPGGDFGLTRHDLVSI